MNEQVTLPINSDICATGVSTIFNVLPKHVYAAWFFFQEDVTFCCPEIPYLKDKINYF